MQWYQNAIFYELYLRAFADGDGNGHGDFAGLRSKLDYLQWLGVDCIWLLPIYPSPLFDDGYDIASFYGVHPDFGVMEDFRLTVDEIHRRGMRIIADLVVNHTSYQHPWFIESRRSKNSPMRDFYVWSQTGEEYQDVRIIFLDTENSNWAYDEESGEYYWHRF
ncbi:MAG: trehalose synthase, partial [Anaerolineae bacterium]|nr:trehalose synthase [Anaerolineae bacterium]